MARNPVSRLRQVPTARPTAPRRRPVRTVWLPAALAAAAWLVGTAAPAQDMTGVIAGGRARIKIAVPDALTSAGFGETTAELIDTLRADLEFDGDFHVVDPKLYDLVSPSPDGQVNHDDWLSIGADSLIQVHVPVQDDRIDLQAYLYDNESKTAVFARRYAGRLGEIRRVAHLMANDIIHHYTGRPGLALSRIAFVSGHDGDKEVYLMDYDGRRLRRLTTSNTINLSPTWSPDASELAFMSWRGRQPGVYVMSAEGELGRLRTVGGELSSSPDWSPEGPQLVYTSDVEGNTEIYLLDRGSGRNTRLTHNLAIDVAPAFSPNGREIAFTSDRSGSPQIYVMDTDGLNPRRLSWESSYNDSPAWAPRGDRLAYAARIDGRFHVVALDLTNGAVTQLTRGRHDNENPRWSPEGRHIVFSSNRAGAYHIYTMRADGSDVRRLTRGEDGYTPDWSK